MDNAAIARVLRETADLLEIKGDNPFKIRAYRNGADIAVNHPHQLASLDETGLRGIPGIGKDLAARILETVATGDCAFHQELLAEFPASILDLLRLQGVGPKTVAIIYRDLGVSTLDELERAALDGRVRALRGMGIKKEALLLKALDERKRHAGRHLLPTARAAADALIAYLLEQVPLALITPVGSLRRGCDTCGDLDLLAMNADDLLMEALVAYPLVERILGRGDTKSSVRLRDGFQADLRLVAPDSLGAALQYFTGSKAHNIALRDRANALGFTLNEYGLFRLDDNTCVAGASEADVYAALELAWIAPELREMQGELEAAAAGTLPRLLERGDLRGDLHMHTTESDGKDSVRAMADGARRAGLEYVAITDHSQSLAMANGLDERRALEHAARIRALNAEGVGVRLLAGIEVDIRPDGSLDLNDTCLAALDIVVASVHSALNQDHEQMTARLLRALENPHVDVLGHPTGRMLLKREAYTFDTAAIVDAAVRQGVALEINCQPHRLDLNDVHARLARDRGARIVVSSDAHAERRVGDLDLGVTVARRAWIGPDHVLNTLPFDQFRSSLRRHRP